MARWTRKRTVRLKLKHGHAGGRIACAMIEERLIPPQESLSVEFKSDCKGPLGDKDLTLAVVCLANAQGGDLYLGVEDDGTITGLHPSRDTQRDLAAVVASRTTPPLAVTATWLTAAATTAAGQPLDVVWLQVPPSQGVVFTQDGRAQIRTVDPKGKPTCRPITAVDVLRRASQQLELDWSAQPAAAATLADLNPAERDRLRSMVRRYRGDAALLDLSDLELDLALGLVSETANGEMVPTHAGLLLLGHEASLRRLVPGHEVGFQILQDTDVRVNRFQRSPLLAIVDDITQRLDPFVVEQEIEVGLFRVPVPNLQLSAFREAFINALAHRDYTALAAVHVQWQLGESLTISNPGGFVRGVTIANLLTAPPRSRNPLLADALKRIGLAERTGRGVDRIFEGMLTTGRSTPSYARTTADDVVLELSTRPANLQLVALWQNYQRRTGSPLGLLSLLVLHTLHDQRKLSIQQLSIQLVREEPLIRRQLEQLVEADLVSAQGQGRGRIYMLSQPVYAAFSQEETYRQQQVLSVNEVDRRILELVQTQAVIRRKDVVETLGLTDRQASHALRRLCQRNALVPVGSNKARTYHLPPTI